MLWVTMWAKHYENDRDWTGIRPTDPHAVAIDHCAYQVLWYQKSDDSGKG